MRVDVLTLFGLLSVSLMLLFYSLEARSPWFVLAFGGSCALGSIYGFLQGAWPFGFVESIWSVVAVRRWWVLRREPLKVVETSFQRRLLEAETRKGI